MRAAEQIQCAVPRESSERITTHGMRLLVTRVLHDPPSCMSRRWHALQLLIDRLLTDSPSSRALVVTGKKRTSVAPRKGKQGQRPQSKASGRGTTSKPTPSSATATPNASPLRERQPAQGKPSPTAPSSSEGPSPSVLLDRGGPPSKKPKASKPVVFSAAAKAATARATPAPVEATGVSAVGAGFVGTLAGATPGPQACACGREWRVFERSLGRCLKAADGAIPIGSRAHRRRFLAPSAAASSARSLPRRMRPLWQQPSMCRVRWQQSSPCCSWQDRWSRQSGLRRLRSL